MQPPFSAQFGDIYFSAEDGLAETRHVFLDGNGLPGRWADRKRFTIAETGFGTGLNFLAAWMLFEKTAPADAVLDYVAVELYPMTAEEIGAALEQWRGQFGGRLEALQAQWPLRIPGFHRLHFPRVRLTLIFDDVQKALPEIIAPRGVDAWFLDGFAPAKNPDMWAEELYQQMARLSNQGTTVATFTAAGLVRRGLAEAGFAVEKKQGYGRKRDMVVARFGGEARPEFSISASVGIEGGGLAGTSCAYALKRRGIAACIYEKNSGLASGTSGNQVGLCNPRFYARRTQQSDFYAAAYAMAYAEFRSLNMLDACGSLHLVNSLEKEKRFASMLQHWGWDKTHMHCLKAQQSLDISGVKIDADILYLPQSMQVSPAALCTRYASDIPVSFNTSAFGDHDAVVLANGPGVLARLDLPLHTVRGQVTMVEATARSRDLKTNLCFGGYISACRGGQHVVGSSFQKWLDHTDVLPQDDADNMKRLAEHVPALAGEWQILSSRAGLRVASKDHFPVAGPVPGRDRHYASTAHGSHGIISSLACAELLADRLDGSPYCLPAATVEALSPDRFSKQ